jgi:hypothetical protein
MEREYNSSMDPNHLPKEVSMDLQTTLPPLDRPITDHEAPSGTVRQGFHSKPVWVRELEREGKVVPSTDPWWEETA